MSDQQVIDFLRSLNKAGGELTVAPGDWLNPGCGYYARVRLPSGNSQGFTQQINYGSDGIEALSSLIKSCPGLPSPII